MEGKMRGERQQFDVAARATTHDIEQRDFTKTPLRRPGYAVAQQGGTLYPLTHVEDQSGAKHIDFRYDRAP
jgi:hypothetical protein